MLKIETAIIGTKSQVKWATDIRKKMLTQLDRVLENARRRVSEGGRCVRYAEIVEEMSALAVKNLASFNASKIIAGKDRNFGDFIEAKALQKLISEVAK